jgi:hypothetical protein
MYECENVELRVITHIAKEQMKGRERRWREGGPLDRPGCISFK